MFDIKGYIISKYLQKWWVWDRLWNHLESFRMNWWIGQHPSTRIYRCRIAGQPQIMAPVEHRQDADPHPRLYLSLPFRCWWMLAASMMIFRTCSELLGQTYAKDKLYLWHMKIRYSWRYLLPNMPQDNVKLDIKLCARPQGAPASSACWTPRSGTGAPFFGGPSGRARSSSSGRQWDLSETKWTTGWLGYVGMVWDG